MRDNLLYVPLATGLACVAGIALAAAVGEWRAVAVITLFLVINIAVIVELNGGGWT